MEGKTWAESVDQLCTVDKDGEKFERVIKHVGPIWDNMKPQTRLMLTWPRMAWTAGHGPVHGTLKAAHRTLSLKENLLTQALRALLTRNNVHLRKIIF